MKKFLRIIGIVSLLVSLYFLFILMSAIFLPDTTLPSIEELEELCEGASIGEYTGEEAFSMCMDDNLRAVPGLYVFPFILSIFFGLVAVISLFFSKKRNKEKY